ncbi:hypothetical protein AAVH_23396, partial [Aphelenchoides avenae]
MSAERNTVLEELEKARAENADLAEMLSQQDGVDVHINQMAVGFDGDFDEGYLMEEVEVPLGVEDEVTIDDALPTSTEAPANG